MRLERTSRRATCATCGEPIAASSVRVVERPEPERFEDLDSDEAVHARRARVVAYHLPCAIERHRPLAHHALLAHASRAFVDEVLPIVAAHDAALATQVRAALAATRAPDVPIAGGLPGDDATRRLLAALEAAPDDRALYAALGAHLRALGDARGELIELQLAASSELALIRREAALRTAHVPAHSQLVVGWGIGFARRVEIMLATTPLAAWRWLFEHPSCRLLVEVAATVWATHPLLVEPGLLPRSVRQLRITGGLAAASEPALAALPRLSALELEWPKDPTAADAIAPRAVPHVRRLALHGAPGEVVRAFVERGWLAQLTALEVRDAALDADTLASIERALGGRRLALLDLRGGTPLAPATVQLARRLADSVLVEEQAAVEGALVEHTGKPEWGRGHIVRRYDGKIEVAFASGTRTFKDGAPFLRIV